MSVEGYLQRYAEPEVSLLSDLSGSWARAVVVPCCDEFEGIPTLLDSLQIAACEAGGSSLAVLVINAREDASDAVHATNARLLQSLGGAGVRGYSAALDVLVIDRSSVSRRLPSDQGVGLARKIGCDVVTALRHGGRVASRWIWTTDADVEVPISYFTCVDEASDAVAINLPFVHVTASSDCREAVAIRLYDLSLRYYLAGLRYAASPYAFMAIGSTMVVCSDAYAKVRGFPKRQAAEDFHLLSKLAKIGPVVSADGAPLRVQGRVSYRVPFGTGAAVARLVADEDPEGSFLMYDPRSFEELRVWLRALEGFAEHRDDDELWRQIDADSRLEPGLRAAVAAELKVPAALRRAATASPNGAVVSRHLRTWFDALKTLRFIHEVRDRQWPRLPWRAALAAAPF